MTSSPYGGADPSPSAPARRCGGRFQSWCEPGPDPTLRATVAWAETSACGCPRRMPSSAYSVFSTSSTPCGGDWPERRLAYSGGARSSRRCLDFTGGKEFFQSLTGKSSLLRRTSYQPPDLRQQPSRSPRSSAAISSMSFWAAVGDFPRCRSGSSRQVKGRLVDWFLASTVQLLGESPWSFAASRNRPGRRR